MKQKVLDYLDSLNISYEVTEHAYVNTMDDLKAEGLDRIGVLCKNLFVRDQKGKNHYLIFADDKTEINMRELGEKIGSGKLSFCSPERLEKYLGVTPGCVSPFGLLNDTEHCVKVYLDKNLSGVQKLGAHPNVHDATVWLSFDDLYLSIKNLGNKVEIIDL